MVVCACESVNVCMNVCRYACIYIFHMKIFLYLCIYEFVCIRVGKYVLMYVFKHICMNAGMCICKNERIYA